MQTSYKPSFLDFVIPNSASKAVLVLLLLPIPVLCIAYVIDQIDSKYFNINPQLENKEVRGRRLLYKKRREYCIVLYIYIDKNTNVLRVGGYDNLKIKGLGIDSPSCFSKPIMMH